jgi:hypothetical protein
LWSWTYNNFLKGEYGLQGYLQICGEDPDDPAVEERFEAVTGGIRLTEPGSHDSLYRTNGHSGVIEEDNSQ